MIALLGSRGVVQLLAEEDQLAMVIDEHEISKGPADIDADADTVHRHYTSALRWTP